MIPYLHFHGNHHNQRISFLHLSAWLYSDPLHHTWHGSHGVIDAACPKAGLKKVWQRDVQVMAAILEKKRKNQYNYIQLLLRQGSVKQSPQ